MLTNALNTNEIKDAAGAEIEFQRLSSSERACEYGKITELPGYPHRLNVSHTEIGSGTSRRRRSLVKFELTAQGGVDTTQSVKTSCYCVLDIPVGNVATYNDSKTVLANLMSFLATTGAATTVLFDCTGTGAKTLVDGSV